MDERASTEELRDKALNLVIPEKPVKRHRVPAVASKSRNTVDVGEMLGLKPSISQRSLHSLQSDCSGFSDNEWIPPPAKPPPKNSEIVKNELNSSTDIVKGGETSENLESKSESKSELANTPTNKDAPALPPRRSIPNGSPLKTLPVPNVMPVPPPRPVHSSGVNGAPPAVGPPPKLPPRRTSLQQSGSFEKPALVEKVL